jgi:hypothetical protein
VTFAARRKSPLTGLCVADPTLDVYVEMNGNIEAFANNRTIYSVIVACFGEDIRIFVSLDNINPEVEYINNELLYS